MIHKHANIFKIIFKLKSTVYEKKLFKNSQLFVHCNPACCWLQKRNKIDWFSTDRYTYNSEGLVDSFKDDFFGNVYVYATMQYDKNGRVVTGGISYDGQIYDHVVFEYDKDKIAKETYYEAGTSNVNDLAINAYNNKGQLIRREDPIYDLYTTFEYDAVGNNTKNELRYLSNNFLVDRRIFHYNKQIKNPETARP